jgi:hypothetical protein
MLPKFNEEGYLPMGIHKATLNEIKQRFGSNSSKRKELFESFQSLVRLLEKHKESIKRFLLNGSYVTSKESPEDFDCILVVKNDFDFNSFEAKQLRHSKELFNGHILMAMEEDTINYHDAVDFFGHDRDKKAKGMVEVIL